jgi:hypothetical protein
VESAGTIISPVCTPYSRYTPDDETTLAYGHVCQQSLFTSRGRVRLGRLLGISRVKRALLKCGFAEPSRANVVRAISHGPGVPSGSTTSSRPTGSPPDQTPIRRARSPS